MKIGLVLPSVPAYSETFFTNKVNGLEEKGFKVLVFVNNANTTHFNISNTRLAPRLTGSFLRVGIVSALRLIGSILFHFNSTKHLYLLDKADKIAFSQRIKNIISNSHILAESLDWLHFGFGTMVFNRENVAKAISAKMAVSFRGFDIGVYPLKNPDCYERLWNKLDKIHVISDDIRDLLYTHGFKDQADVIKITPAINTSLFKSDNKEFLGNKNHFITIARLHWKKGLEYTLEALALLKKESIPFHYTIIGEGIEYERLKFSAYQLGIDDHVTFTGKMAHKQIINELNKADIYIQYSIQEGFCNAVLEAQALGLLCIVSNSEGLSENVLNNETGWVVPKCNSKELANKIIQVINLPQNKKQDIAKNAKERVSKHFEMHQQKQQYVEFYKE
ncbi:glycosyltransferase family 4 protein [Confluentibacter citreus]|uniref:glycosyltransferase family 4 protein n=1 Tax=Confluentibacter citreus TaxID=2007307 RepID=UPI000C292481|nr:glycosyltransferase family 4 protein [Confluentibacter citreus]